MDLRGLLWRAYLSLGLVAIGAYFLLPHGSFTQANFYDAFGLVAVAAIVVGARLHRPPAASAWYMIAAGQLLFVAGDAAWNLFEYVLHIAPFPSVADAFYLAGYPLIAGGLLRLLRARRHGPDRAGLIDASIVTIGLGMLAWVFLIDPYVDDHTLTGLESFFSIAYPLGDVLVLSVAVRLAFGATEPNPAFRLLGAGLVAILAADVVYGYQILAGSYYTGSPVDLGYLLSYLLIAVAALHPRMQELSQPQQALSSKDARRRLALLAIAALLAPVAMVLQASHGVESEDVPVFALGSATMFLLVVARLSGLLREVESKDADRKRLLGRTLRVAEDERVRIAADLHDGPVQRLAMIGYSLERARGRFERGDPEGALEALDRSQEALSGEVERLRSLMSSLRPPALDEQGLDGALRDQGATFYARTGVECRVDANLQSRPDREVETILYRVAQEALRNVAKHARASHVWLGVRQDNGSVELAVRDDGVGFHPVVTSELVQRGNFGLVAMREQLRMAGGSCEITSRPGEGTTVRAVLSSEGAR